MPGTPTKFRDSLVDFDYETWRKFGLKLYWPKVKGELDVVWPLKILTIRVHPTYPIVALVREDCWEEIVSLSMETGENYTGRRALMDLDSLWEPAERANTKSGKLLGVLRSTWNVVKLYWMLIWRWLKTKYGK